MKKIIIMAVMALLSNASIFAQTAKDLAKQQRELNEINMKLLNSKPSKDAKKQAKKLIKDGWIVCAGDKTIAKQITETQLLGEELMADELGNPTKRYIIRSAQSIAGTFDAGIAAARSNAQVELAAMLETKVAAALESKLDNQQNSAITAITVDKFHERAKAIIDASLTNTRTLLSIYRVNKQNNYEVQVQVAFDKKELAARLKRNIKKELEQEGDEELNDIVDSVLAHDL
ncbi:MAG: hypothetical protein MJY52_00200 [Bacteroidaceae bacterium]|nr:hypothetical protein [Bacteroidaceae bacterium]